MEVWGLSEALTRLQKPHSMTASRFFLGSQQRPELDEAYLSKILELKHGVPSHVSLTAIVEGVDYKEFERSINHWSKSKRTERKRSSKDKTKNVISLDGKAIKSSVKNGTSKSQNFIAFVNAFCSENEIVVTSMAYENGKGSEQQTLRDLIAELGIKGAVFTADAAHPSKNL